MNLAVRLLSAFGYFLREEAGASLTEYVLVASLVAAVCGIVWLAVRKAV